MSSDWGNDTSHEQLVSDWWLQYPEKEEQELPMSRSRNKSFYDLSSYPFNSFGCFLHLNPDPLDKCCIGARMMTHSTSCLISFVQLFQITLIAPWYIYIYILFSVSRKDASLWASPLILVMKIHSSNRKELKSERGKQWWDRERVCVLIMW